jgi:hypothetical protein
MGLYPLPTPCRVWENGGRKGELKRFIFLLSPPIGSAEGGGDENLSPLVQL